MLTSIPASYPAAHVDTWDRVTSWKWLRLPKGASTKKRSRKDAKICSYSPYYASARLLTRAAPVQDDVLDLSVEVVCLSNPEVSVSCCDSCQQREVRHLHPLLPI